MKMSESDEKTQVLENPASKVEIKKKKRVTKKPRISAYFWFLLGLPVLFVVIVVGWFGWQQWQIMRTGLERIEYLNVELDTHIERANSQSIMISNREIEHLESSKELFQQIINLQLQVNAQGARITELGSTTRTDWYLSEAVYLARLASQRLQTERGTKNPLALLQKVDSILLEIDEGGISAVRAAIAADTTALRLAGEIDIEGIVLELNTLAVQIDELPMIQLSVNFSETNQNSDDNSLANRVVDESPSQRWSALIDEFTQSLGQLVQVKQRLQPIERVLSASEESVVRNNVRLLLQQAANAALREQQSIYDLSLKRAQQWLTQYFQMNSSVEVIKDRLIKLGVEQVVQELPLIDGSVNALEAFMIVRQSNLVQGSAEVVEIGVMD
jgi:uroporphyrin-3 C-methyltransferase